VFFLRGGVFLKEGVFFLRGGVLEKEGIFLHGGGLVMVLAAGVVNN